MNRPQTATQARREQITRQQVAALEGHGLLDVVRDVWRTFEECRYRDRYTGYHVAYTVLPLVELHVPEEHRGRYGARVQKGPGATGVRWDNERIVAVKSFATKRAAKAWAIRQWKEYSRRKYLNKRRER